MRNFFIRSFELIATVIVAVGSLAIIVIAIDMAMTPEGGILGAIAVLIGGFSYLCFLVGGIFLAIGIHDNTKRTALAVEELLRRQR